MSDTLDEWADAILAGVPALRGIKPAVESELLAMAAFGVVNARRLLPADAVFVGGTALRFCHGSPRFSEDLDFHTPVFAPRTLDREALRRGMEAIVGCEVSVREPMSAASSTLARITAVLPGTRRDERRPRTKIDLGAGKQLDASPTLVTLRAAGGLLPGMGDIGDPFSFPASSREEILVDKHLALVGPARRVKQRDVFDILWMHHQSVSFRPDLLAAKLDERRRTAFVGELERRAAQARQSMQGGDYRAEMSRFLPSESTWLFNEEGRMDGMAAAFETLVLNNAKRLAAEIERPVVAMPISATEASAPSG